MRRVLLGALAGLMIPMYSAYADIATDLKNADLSMQAVIEKAQDDNKQMSLEDIVAEIASTDPEKAAAAAEVAAGLPGADAAAITKAAIGAAGLVHATAIRDAATRAAPSQAIEINDATLAALISSDADATAAGTGTPTLTAFRTPVYTPPTSTGGGQSPTN